MPFSNKHYFFDIRATLKTRGAATRDAIGGATYAYTDSYVWVSMKELNAGTTANYFAINYFGKDNKKVLELTARADFTVTTRDKIEINSITYDVLDVQTLLREGIQRIYIRSTDLC